MFGPLLPLFFIFVLLPLLLVFLQVHVVTLAFTRLGLSQEMVILAFYLSLLGSFVNVPISRRRIVVYERPPLPLPFGFPLFYYPPRVQERVLAVNVGGAIVPLALSLYILPKAPLLPLLVSTGIMTLVAFALARPVEGVGITMPAFIPPVLVAVLAWLLVPEGAGRTAVAYIAGVVGTLLGADVLNLPRIHKKLGAHVVSIGGAGVFDGIFLVGVLAAVLT
jgi:uncharacterized membrane protein